MMQYSFRLMLLEFVLLLAVHGRPKSTSTGRAIGGSNPVGASGRGGAQTASSSKPQPVVNRGFAGAPVGASGTGGTQTASSSKPQTVVNRGFASAGGAPVGASGTGGPQTTVKQSAPTTSKPVSAADQNGTPYKKVGATVAVVAAGAAAAGAAYVGYSSVGAAATASAATTVAASSTTQLAVRLPPIRTTVQPVRNTVQPIRTTVPSSSPPGSPSVVSQTSTPRSITPLPSSSSSVSSGSTFNGVAVASGIPLKNMNPTQRTFVQAIASPSRRK